MEYTQLVEFYLGCQETSTSGELWSQAGYTTIKTNERGAIEGIHYHPIKFVQGEAQADLTVDGLFLSFKPYPTAFRCLNAQGEVQACYSIQGDRLVHSSGQYLEELPALATHHFSAADILACQTLSLTNSARANIDALIKAFGLPLDSQVFRLDSEENKREKAILFAYFRHPEQYIAQEHYQQYWRPWATLPNGLKLTRVVATKKDEDEKPVYCRYFILPGQTAVNTIKIPLIHHQSKDSALHSAEIINNKLLFHQNAEDLPRIPDDDSENDFDEDDSVVLTSEQQEAKDRYQALFQKSSCTKNYFKVGSLRLLEPTCKWVMTQDDQRYVIKIKPLVDDQLPCLLPAHCIQSLYLCDSFIRNGKQYDIMHYKGQGLEVFLTAKGASLTLTQQDFIAESLLRELAMLQAQSIVLTDIKAKNICIQENISALNPYSLSYIDDSDGFQGENTLQGYGTVGHYAPEFFGVPHPPLDELFDFLRWQEDLYRRPAALKSSLAPEFRTLFCQATDTFALGCVLLRDLALSPASHFYALAQSMCAFNPEERPDLTTLFSCPAIARLK